MLQSTANDVPLQHYSLGYRHSLTMADLNLQNRYTSLPRYSATKVPRSGVKVQKHLRESAQLSHFGTSSLLRQSNFRFKTCRISLFPTPYVWMILGVMKKISSEFEVVTLRCLNRLPRYGTLPSNGTWSTLTEFCIWITP